MSMPRTVAILLILLAIGFIENNSSQNLAMAQAEFGTQNGNARLEEEFRDELDKWMLRAYEGDRDAQFKVGVLFTNDQFDKPDYEQAVYWYKQAARQGHVLAQYNLGHQFLTGVGVAKNDSTAMQWWLRAAEQDHALAQFNVGRAYYLGIGLSMDHVLSKYWFERAAYNQEPKSIDILKQLGWYTGNVATKPTAPALGNQRKALSDEENVVLQSSQAKPEPAESSKNSYASAQNGNRTNSPLTSRITPVARADQASESVANSPERVNSPKPALTNQSPNRNQQSTAASSAPQPVATEQTPPQANVPVAIYTNPQVRSVLIAIIDDRQTIDVVEYGDDWSIVQSTKGFPVWIHGDFIAVKNNIGTIIGQAVNARSVPIITNGTVVGKLDKGEKVAILSKRKEWYRVTAPTHFEAWVKTEDYNRKPTVVAAAVAPAPAQVSNKAKANVWVANTDKAPVVRGAKTVSDKKPKAQSNNKMITNDNAWLFSQPTENYTLQLASFDDPEKVQQFVSKRQFLNNPQLHQFTATGKELDWTYFLYGSYLDREQAESAKIEISQKRAWVRTFGRLQENRCLAWKTQLPSPPELNEHCIE